MLTQTTKNFRISYSAPVSNCVRKLRVMPPQKRGSQCVLKSQWRCAPEPDAIREVSDEWGNRVLEIRHRHIEREFCFELAFHSQRETCDAPRETNLPPSGIGAYLLPSRLCDLTPQIAKTACEIAESVPKSTPEFGRTFAVAETLCSWTHRALRYESKATQIETTASQVLARGGGVCQDFAHLMIALCRAQNLAARYVSGYNRGEGAMHAWVEVLCGERGSDVWIAFDPTHNRRTRDDCVFVAAGRDFRDVSPMSGTFRGGATARLETSCKTIEISKSRVIPTEAKNERRGKILPQI